MPWDVTKLDLLDRILTDVRQRVRAIVFARTKRSADRVAARLKTRGHAVAVLHGDREQRQRERAMLDFKRGRAHVLVATDIASRGIDVDHVTHVINYEAPRSPEDYVHRIGRTGRMEASGEAITLMSPEERDQVTDIERFQGRAIERVSMKGFEHSARAESPRGTEERRSRRTDERRSLGRMAPVTWGQARPARARGAEGRAGATAAALSAVRLALPSRSLRPRSRRRGRKHPTRAPAPSRPPRLPPEPGRRRVINRRIAGTASGS
jgi:ATP-dependent RNA helicase RhlE